MQNSYCICRTGLNHTSELTSGEMTVPAVPSHPLCEIVIPRFCARWFLVLHSYAMGYVMPKKEKNGLNVHGNSKPSVVSKGLRFLKTEWHSEGVAGRTEGNCSA
jgi:hypothetical protein